MERHAISWVAILIRDVTEMGVWAILATASVLVARMVSVLVQTLVWSSESGDDWMIGWYPGWESNPHEEKSPEDFKSSASAIPPPGHSAVLSI